MSGTIDPAGHAGGPVLVPTRTPTSSTARTGTPCPRCSRTPASAGRSTTRRATSSDRDRPASRSTADPRRRHPPLLLPVQEPGSALYQKAFLPQYPADFAADVGAGTLPAVSWLIPPAGYDEHPPAPPALGEWFTSQVLATLTSNPEVWSKTVLFHMYDENDGFFDHVPPPVPPRRHAGRVPDRSAPAGRRSRRSRSRRPGLPGPAAGRLALQPRRPRLRRRSSTTPRSCASSRSASGCAPPTSRPGAARRRAT